MEFGTQTAGLENSAIQVVLNQTSDTRSTGGMKDAKPVTVVEPTTQPSGNLWT